MSTNQEETTSSSEESEKEVFAVGKESKKGTLIAIKVENVNIKMFIDCGSTVDLIIGTLGNR